MHKVLGVLVAVAAISLAPASWAATNEVSVTMLERTSYTYGYDILLKPSASLCSITFEYNVDEEGVPTPGDLVVVLECTAPISREEAFAGADAFLASMDMEPARIGMYRKDEPEGARKVLYRYTAQE